MDESMGEITETKNYILCKLNYFLRITYMTKVEQILIVIIDIKMEHDLELSVAKPVSQRVEELGLVKVQSEIFFACSNLCDLKAGIDFRRVCCWNITVLSKRDAVLVVYGGWATHISATAAG